MSTSRKDLPGRLYGEEKAILPKVAALGRRSPDCTPNRSAIVIIIYDGVLSALQH